MEAVIFSPFKVDYIVHPFGVWAIKLETSAVMNCKAMSVISHIGFTLFL